MGCRCGKRGQALRRAAAAVASGNGRAAAVNAGYVGRSLGRDAGTIARDVARQVAGRRLAALARGRR